MTSWKSVSTEHFQSFFSSFGPILFCFPAPKPWAKAAAPHTQQCWCSRQASATVGFKLQQLSPRVENFQNVLPWQPGILAQQKPAPCTPRLQRARRWASIYHFLQRENTAWGRWCRVCLLGGIASETGFFPATCTSWLSWQPLFSNCILS